MGDGHDQTGIRGRPASPSCGGVHCSVSVTPTGQPPTSVPATGVEVEVDTEPLCRHRATGLRPGLDVDPLARSSYDRPTYSHKREHLRVIESAKKPETRARRIEKAIAVLRDPQVGRSTQARLR